MQKFPSIEQFRHVVRAVRDNAKFHDTPPPTMTFTGTVKLHGTNAGITKQQDVLTYMSRNRTLKLGDDNAGFVAAMSGSVNATIIHEIFDFLDGLYGDDHMFQLFGEWCGAGIQKGVAITELGKRFIIFAVRVDDTWVDPNCLAGLSYGDVYLITDFPTFEIEIDFNHPELSQNQMVEITEGVEAECPVGKAFGVTGIGEGVVWTPSFTHNPLSDSRYWFKVKGEKHSVSKVAKLASVDIEAFRAKEELVAALVTDNRLNQALDYHINEARLSLEVNQIGAFLRWVFNDVVKEETDTIEAAGFNLKDLGKLISDVAKRYYMKALDSQDVTGSLAA